MITFNQDSEATGSRSEPIASSHPRYEVFEDEVLAEEPWGKTIVGFDLDTGQNVAVSVVDPTTIAKRDDADRFWRQVARRASIEHAGLLAIREVDQDRHWIVTDAVRVGWMPDARRQRANISARVSADLRALLGGLEALHRGSLTVGAWRPEELGVNEQGKAQLRCLAPGAPVTMIEAAPPEGDPYLAPERVVEDGSGRGTPSTDLYGVGVCLLFGLLGGDLSKAIKTGLLSRKASFGASTRGWVAVKKLAPGLSAQVAAVIDRLVEKSPSERYAEASSALADLTDETAEQPAPAAAAAPDRKRVVMQRSPLAENMTNEHFKPINPVEVDNETKIEKLLSPERIYERVKQPMVIAGLLGVVVAFLALTRSGTAPLPKHTLAIQIQDQDERPLTRASLTIQNNSGINKTYSLGEDSGYDVRLPQGSYELTVTLSGYRQKTKNVEVVADSLSPEILVLQADIPIQSPSTVTITPSTVDGNDSESETRFEFFQITDQIGADGKPVEKLLGAGFYDYTIEEMLPGDELSMVVRAVGYVEESLQVEYDEFGATLKPVLQRAPRWLVIQVDQPGTRLWADTEEIVGDQKSSGPLGDTYRLQVPYSKPSISVDVLCDGFKEGIDEIPTPKGTSDLVHRIKLERVPPPPAHPLRKIEVATAGTMIYINGKLLGKTRLETGLPAGLHRVVLKRPDGAQRHYEVRFSNLLNQVAFDF